MARRWLAEQMISWAWACDKIDTAVFLVGELATNAVRHARSEPRLIVTACAGVLRCAVHDDSPDLPAPRQPGWDAESGRGLQLVAGLSYAWGVDDDVTNRGGKSVWFELRA